jgi:hypothetical protein
MDRGGKGASRSANVLEGWLAMHTLLEAAHSLRRVVPINHWIPVVGLLGFVASLLLWRRVAGWLRWRPLPTLLTLLAATAVVSLTLTPRGWWGNHRSLARCVPSDWADLADSMGRVGTSLESWLNIAMLVPLGVGLVLASRRVVWPAVLLVLLPVAIELTQVVVPGRQCSAADWAANALGGLIGVTIGALGNRWADDWARTRAPRQVTEERSTRRDALTR